VGIEHLDAAGSRVEMHVVAPVMNRFPSLAVVQIEVPGNRGQALANQGLGQTRHPVIALNSDFNSRRLQEPDGRRAYADSRVHQQLKRFAKYAADKFRTKQLDFRSHAKAVPLFVTLLIRFFASSRASMAL